MTSSDLESRPMSTLQKLNWRPLVGNLPAKSEGHNFIIIRVIVYNVKLGQWPLVTLKVGQSQPYTYENIVIW
jgi:hypothetical protein